MQMNESPWKISAPYNTLMSLRGLMEEVCRQIIEYRDAVPIVPELCLPTAAKEVSLTPLIMQAAYNLHRGDKPVFWPVSEITTTRSDTGAKGRIDIGLFSPRHATLIECKAVRSGINNNNIKVREALERASEQLQNIDLDNLFFNSLEEAIRNRRANNKLVSLVAINVTCQKNSEEKSVGFARKLAGIKQGFPTAMIVSVEYEPHFIRVKGDMELKIQERKSVSIGHIFILQEAFMK